jgi:hypothetical protein
MFLPFIWGCCVFVINKNSGLVWSFESQYQWKLALDIISSKETKNDIYDIWVTLDVKQEFFMIYLDACAYAHHFHGNSCHTIFHNDLILYFLIYDSSNLFFPTNALINKIKTMSCFSLCSCDDDWYAQEESSTLSFPSYYIDAEVTILR